MSSNDKAKQKLMESMRMTKAGSSNQTREADKKRDMAPQDDKPARQKKKVAVTKKTSKDIQRLSVDPYQTAGRVWPD